MRNLLFISSTHGDEGFSVDVLKDLEQTYDPQLYGYDWVIGNPRALDKNVRFTEKDLNRSAPGDLASPVYEERRAAEIVKLSRNYDAVIDIHSTVADCGLVKLIPYPTAENMALARSIPLARNVIWYAEESAIQGPLTQHTLCPAVEIECGPKMGEQITKDLKECIGRLLVANISGELTIPEQEYYSVYGPQPGATDNTIKDFQEITTGDETFYPFLANQYAGTLCYKMTKVLPEEVLL